jgi:hypothetical protein
MTDFSHQLANLRTMKVGKTALALATALVLLTTGCQTFSMTDEEFYRQQRGQSIDPETGAVVGTAGTLGYWGAMIAAAVAGKH